MKNMFYPIEFRLKEEIGKDAKPYRSWWNDIAKDVGAIKYNKIPLDLGVKVSHRQFDNPLVFANSLLK
jgi:hypothetical protein